MTYVDESKPITAFNLSPSVVLSENGYDSLGHYVSNNRRIIFISFLFPALIKDDRVSIIDASIQMVRTDAGGSIGFSTHSVPSDWDASSTTFNSRPGLGSGLYSGIMAGRGTWPVLTLGGFQQLILSWRANQPVYGVQIWGTDIPISSYTKKPSISFKVRY
jgi:hypothetical protein